MRPIKDSKQFWSSCRIFTVAIGLCILQFTAYGQEGAASVPPGMIGTWKIVSEYETRNVTGLDSLESRRLIGSRLTFSELVLQSCGQSVPINSVQIKQLSAKEFFAGMYVDLSEVHVSSPSITEVLINGDSSGNCRGSLTLPGEHLYLKSDRELLIQYEGGFFRAVRFRKASSVSQKP